MNAVWTGAGVAYIALTLTSFGVSAEARAALAALLEPMPSWGRWRTLTARKLDELANCPYCASFWVALVAERSVWAAFTVAGIASVFISIVVYTIGGSGGDAE